MKVALLLTEVAGGVLLFIYGMRMLSEALRASAAERLRQLLAGATRSRLRGLFLGTLAGTLVHSSAATSMTVGFVHAGLLTLGGALPVILGANVGTTLSMQLISLRLTDYALGIVAAGVAILLATPGESWERVGKSLLGFGLLFLGMKLSGDALEPHRDLITPFLAKIDGSRLDGLLLGVGIATVATAAVQSSGAVIGLTFVLAGAGVLRDLNQTYPIVLGAHIGTTVTALLASIGTSAQARAAAVSNTLFNLFDAALGIAAASWLVPLLKETSGDLVHQTANAHTVVMLLGVLLALPFAPAAAELLERVLRPDESERPGSHLDSSKLDTPEDAIAAVVRELGRCTDLCCESFHAVNTVFQGGEEAGLRRVPRNERAIDEIKDTTRAFLHRLARGYLSRRQALMVQALDRCALEVERIGDHIDKLCYHVRADGGDILSELDERAATDLARLAELAEDVVQCLAESFLDERTDFEAESARILEARDAYVRERVPLRRQVNDRLSRHEVPARLVLAFGEYSVALDRIVRHCAVIAQEERQSAFHIKEAKLGRRTRDSARPAKEQ